MNDRDILRDAIADSEAAANDPNDAPVEDNLTRPDAGPMRPVAIRMSEQMLADLDKLHEETGVPVSALVRGFIAEGISSHRTDSLDDAIARIESDLQRLRLFAG